MVILVRLQLVPAIQPGSEHKSCVVPANSMGGDPAGAIFLFAPPFEPRMKRDGAQAEPAPAMIGRQTGCVLKLDSHRVETKARVDAQASLAQNRTADAVPGDQHREIVAAARHQWLPRDPSVVLGAEHCGRISTRSRPAETNNAETADRMPEDHVRHMEANAAPRLQRPFNVFHKEFPCFRRQ
jgi:hypothetical protein